MGLVSNNIVISNLQVQPNIKEFISSESLIIANFGTVGNYYGLPPGTQVGDLMFAVYAQSPSGGSWTVPLGWTELFDVFGISFGISFRVAQPGDQIASFTWTSTEQGGVSGLLAPISFLHLSFRNVVLDNYGSFSAAVSGNSTITVPGVTTTTFNTIILLFIISSEAFRAPSTPSGFTLRAQTVSQQTAPERPSVFVYMRDEPGIVVTPGNAFTNFSDSIGTHIGVQIALKYGEYNSGGGGGDPGGGGP